MAPDWGMRRELMSQSYTTRLDHPPGFRAKGKAPQRKGLSVNR
ncbi:DUF4113 domain-containing protein [Pseudomonas sp. BN102]|nr:DUF4113 domain-containing protein [Pseudomonas sp. BN102]